MNKKKFLKYAASDVTFAEYPNEVALYIEISGCPIHCPECHSKFLWENVGVELTDEVITHIIRDCDGITAVVIGGGDQDEKGVIRIIQYIKTHFPTLKICWYSGKEHITQLMDSFIQHDKMLDAIKLGPYIESHGPLNKETTNQRFFRIDYSKDEPELVDDTYLFWKKEL